MGERSGLTLVEMLVVMTIVAIVAVLGTWAAPNGAAGDARHLAAFIAKGRLLAVASGAATSFQCGVGGGTGSHSVDLTARVTWPPRGLLFTPDGLPRTCDGGGVGNTTILLEHRGRQAAVIVSSLGRVRWELR